jgi:hypothetical protein
MTLVGDARQGKHPSPRVASEDNALHEEEAKAVVEGMDRRPGTEDLGTG